MSKIQAFLLLPESSSIHSILPDNYQLLDGNTLQVFLADLGISLDIIGREKDAQLYYAPINIEAFLESFDEETNELYLINPREVLQEELSAANAEDWTLQKKQKNNIRYFIWNIDAQTQLTPPHTISEIAERQFANENQDKFILINQQAVEVTHNSSITLMRVADNNDKTDIPYVVNADNLENWLIENRKTRYFNVHPKHGENGTGNWGQSRGNKVDVLECSAHEAQELLRNAIGDCRKSERKFFNFDTNRRKYILFYFEGNNPQNQFHGFHIPNENENKEVFPNLRKILQKKYSI